MSIVFLVQLLEMNPHCCTRPLHWQMKMCILHHQLRAHSILLTITMKCKILWSVENSSSFQMLIFVFQSHTLRDKPARNWLRFRFTKSNKNKQTDSSILGFEINWCRCEVKKNIIWDNSLVLTMQVFTATTNLIIVDPNGNYTQTDNDDELMKQNKSENQLYSARHGMCERVCEIVRM